MTIDEQMRILMRGVEFPDRELEGRMRKELQQRLEHKERLRVYLGVDPTTPNLHLGHTVTLQKLKHFQDLGHETIFLIGDFTAMIGDPTGQSETRLDRTKEQVLECAKTYADQAFKILDPERTKVVYNSEWLSPLTFEKIIKLAGKLSLARILSHEDFRKRYERGVSVSLHELLYCLMQGYDALVLDVDAQVGGTDQLFNMLVGRTFQEEYGKFSHIPITMPILIGTDGKRKMSKTYGNDISLTETAQNMYGKIMSIPDTLIGSYFELLTEVPLKEIQDLNLGMVKKTMNPRDVKMRLAKEIVSRFHGKGEATIAEEKFVKLFQKRELPEEIAEIQVVGRSEGDKIPIVELLFETRLVSSKSEARRLLQQGGVYLDGERICDDECAVELKNGLMIRVGRRKFGKLKV